MTMSKTPVTVLQEMMTKLGDVPSYECIAQSGPQHQLLFEYRCKARGMTVTATARSKKEAKQEVAQRMLTALKARGDPDALRAISPNAPQLPSCSIAKDTGEDGKEANKAVDTRSYVALLKELCEEFRLGSVEYTLVGDTGPPHMRHFTIRVALGSHQRSATSTTKKLARQQAAEQLYTYLRENLATATKDFVENCGSDLPVLSEEATEKPLNDSPSKRKATSEEHRPSKRCCDTQKLLPNIAENNEEALSRALDKVMARYVEIREDQPWRPDLGQRVADYHLGLFIHITDDNKQAAIDVLNKDGEDAAVELEALATTLGLTVQLDGLPGEKGSLSVVSLRPTAPPVEMIGRNPHEASVATLRYMRRALAMNPDLFSIAQSS